MRYGNAQGKLLYCHPVPGKEKEWKQWWDEENAREKYRTFGWEVKETLRLPDEEENQVKKQRREFQANSRAHCSPPIFSQGFANKLLTYYFYPPFCRRTQEPNRALC